MNPAEVEAMFKRREDWGRRALAMIQSVYAHLTPQDAYTALEQVIRADG